MSLQEAATVLLGAVVLCTSCGKRISSRGEGVGSRGLGRLGIFAVQLAKHFGAHVTGVCGPST
jgi:D-arabinose 1-dehydrogenase-like Zn-dependent alcohol dehydrogenase